MIKYSSIILFILMIIDVNVSGQIPKEIENPWIIGINKLPPRTAIWPSPNVKSSKQSSYKNAVWVQSLNGNWSFKWSPDPFARPVDFYKPDFDRSDWPKIPVPSTIERQGYGIPLYVNIKYPFKVDPPKVMGEPEVEFTTYKSRNPVGSYCRTFNLDENWSDKEIILHFAGIRSAAFVWVNGHKVGYSQGSRLPAEFNITQYLIKGENLLAVEVYKYSDASYLEDQDFWRLSGIYRDVFIRAVPKITLWDVYAQQKIDLPNKKGKIKLHYTPTNFTKKLMRNYHISVSVSEHSGKTIIKDKLYKINPIEPGINKELKLPEIEITKALLWSNEKPVQYIVEVKLLHKKEIVEVYRLPVGFRKIEVIGNKILLNGLPLKIRGVNRHEFSPNQGYVVTEKQMRQELILMKQANINFVRTSHYPNDPLWYELCNKYGMMIMDEANVESHGLSYHKRILPGDKPEWIYGCVDRMRRMVVRDRQNPSVLMWSLGNEAGFGDAFIEMRKLTLENDPEKRLIQYADMNLAADFDSQTYPTIYWMKQHLINKAKRKGERGEKTHEKQHGKYPSGKPFVLNEYAHAMGNSLGDFADYWKLIYKHDLFAGGFVWDWIDQSLWKNPLDTAKGYAYGGDFGDKPNDKNFCINGIIGSNLQPHPHYEELKKVYQPFYFKLIKEKPLTIELRNNNLVLNADQYNFSYQVFENGVLSSEKELEGLNCSPNKKKQIVINDIIINKEKETFVKFQCSLKKDCLWANKNYTVAWEQFKLSDSNQDFGISTSSGKIYLYDKTNEFEIKGTDFKVVLNKSKGMISNFEFKGQTVISEDVQFNFWRALTDNDKGWKVNEQMKIWKHEALNYSLKSIEIDSTNDSRLIVKSILVFKSTKSKATIKHTFYPDGTIRFDLNINIPNELPNLPRIALQFSMNKDFDKLEWYGRGPHENYSDRKSSSAVGIYQSTVNDWITPYVRPQENGNRCDIRWIKFKNKTNNGFEFSANTEHLFSVNIWPYTQVILEKTMHNSKLKKGKSTTVNINYKQMGVGGDNSWGLPVHDEYLIKPGSYSYSFNLKPIFN